MNILPSKHGTIKWALAVLAIMCTLGTLDILITKAHVCVGAGWVFILALIAIGSFTYMAVTR